MTDGSALAIGTRRAIGGTLRLLLAGPPLFLGMGLTQLAERISAGCRWIEGAPPAPPVAATARGGHSEDGTDLLTYRRAARVLYAHEFDTAAIAELLTESEADVARWVCRPSDARIALEARR